jgi:demethylmenaquinone methyltransferase/2-methoxy-6-polyprenyl-1,4-benzoquinol methylase
MSKADFVQQMFDRIAPSYDGLNDCISLGMHRGWKRRACAALKLPRGGQVLDVCTGTGDLTPVLRKHVGPDGKVVGLDFSANMLSKAKDRFPWVAEFLQGDALALPFEANRFDGAIVSFGLRNVTDVPQALAEMARVVKPGGWVVNLDTSPTPKLPGYWFYFSKVVPFLGGLLALDKEAYAYLAESTRRFYTPEQLAGFFQQAGLSAVTVEHFGFGAVSLQAGQKPKRQSEKYR